MNPSFQAIALPIEPLTRGSRAALLAHWLRLSDDDLRLRFLRCITRTALEAHVAAIDFDAALRLGAWDGGTLVAVVEGFVFDRGGQRAMEVAFSTDSAWRRRGLARALGHAITAAAHERGVERVVACCDARNRAMTSLFDAFDAKTERADGEVSAAWSASARVFDAMTHTLGAGR